MPNGGGGGIPGIDIPEDVITSGGLPSPGTDWTSWLPSWSQVGSFLGGGKEGGGVLGWLDKLSPLVRTGLGVAQIPLSISALNEAARARRGLERGFRTAEQAAAPAAAAAGQLIPAGTQALLGGQLPPEIEANIDAEVNKFRSTKLDQLVRQGVDPQTAQAQVEAEVQEVHNRLRLQWAQSLVSSGGGMTEAATGAAGTAGRLAGGEFQSLEELLGLSQQAMARLLGMA